MDSIYPKNNFSRKSKIDDKLHIRKQESKKTLTAKPSVYSQFTSQSAMNSKKSSFNNNENNQNLFNNDLKKFNNLNEDPRISKLKNDLSSLKSKLLFKIDVQENESINSIKNYLSSIQNALDQMKVQLLQNMNGFTKIITMNLKNSFIELEYELFEIQKIIETTDKRNFDLAQNVDFKIDNFQRKLSNFTFDSSVFPSYELQLNYTDKLFGLIKMNYTPKNDEFDGNEKNLFLESIYDPFLDERIMRNSNHFENEKLIRQTPIIKRQGSDNKINLYNCDSKSNLKLEKNIEKQTELYSKNLIANKMKSMALLPNDYHKNRRAVGSFVEMPDKIPMVRRERTHSRNRVSDEIESMFDLTYVKIVDFSKRKIEEDQLINFLSQLDIKSEGYYLNLSTNNIGDLNLKMILRVLVDHNVSFVNLENNLLTDDSIGFLLSFTNYNNGLQAISICRNPNVKTTNLKFLERKRLLEDKNIKIFY